MEGVDDRLDLGWDSIAGRNGLQEAHLLVLEAEVTRCENPVSHNRISFSITALLDSSSGQC